MVGSRVINAIQSLNNGMAPTYVKTILEHLTINRLIGSVVYPLTLKLVHISGWVDSNNAKGESYDYAGIRVDSGDARGDMDAWVTIGHLEGTNTVEVGVYGTGVQVVYNGALLEKGVNGLYRFNLEYVGD